MNPEAIEWLEALEGDERRGWFQQMYPFDGSFASIKPDHECKACPYLVGDPIVVGEQ